MDRNTITQAARLLAEARRAGRPLHAFEPALAPTSIAEAHAVQDALVGLLGEQVAGYKVAGLEPGQTMRGAILAPRLYETPARIPAGDMPLLGIEAEIAFRIDTALPPRQAPYADDEVRAAVTALPAIEVVDTRFDSYRDTPLLDRLCDMMSNGALVVGAARDDWRAADLTTIDITLFVDGEAVHTSAGGHSNGDPLRPVVAFVNAMRDGTGVAAGQIITAGTYSGLRFVEPGQSVRAAFAGFEAVEVSFPV